MNGILKGCGVGLRTPHYAYIETHWPQVPWFEIISENHLAIDHLGFESLKKIADHYPLTCHGVGLSLGSTDPLNQPYLKKLKTVIDSLHPVWVSDHLSWTSFDNHYYHELLPLPYTEEALNHIVKRIQAVQAYLNRQIVIENISSYLQFKHNTLNEWTFIREIAARADCFILLDINNIIVSAYNNSINPIDYLKELDPARIVQYHLAGHTDLGTHLLDTHSTFVQPNTWRLFKEALRSIGPRPTLIEWDTNIPEFPILLQEAKKAQQMIDPYDA